MTMMAIALLLAAARAGTTAPPDAAAMQAAAARCGLPADWLILGHDEDGDFADPSHEHRPMPISPEPIDCIIQWARQTHARLGLISEPPPGPLVLATLPRAVALEGFMAAEQCGLMVLIAPLDADRFTLQTRRHSPPVQLACVREWLRTHGLS